MSEVKNAHGIIDIIKSIASDRESGRLEISAFRTHGALLFNDGKLVDASLGSLKGFQAVNAAVALRDVQFSFVHSAFTPPSGSIAPNERIVLSHFFGIEAAEMDEAHSNIEPEVDWTMAPEPVVPLAEVDDVQQEDLPDTPTIEAPPVAASVRDEAPAEAAVVVGETSGPSERQLPVNDDLIVHAHKFRPARVALYLTLILALTAAVAIVLLSKLNAPPQLASAATSIESKSQPLPESPIAEVKEKTVSRSEQQVKLVTSKSPSVPQQQSTPARSGSSLTAVTAKPRDKSELRDVNAHNVAGEWKVINTVEKTAYKPYDAMEVGFRLRIKQTGKDFTATGEKFSENGRNLPAKSRTPIRLTGSIEGDEVVATFVEDGLMRRSNGRFVWRLQSGGLTGTFVSTAANSRGKSAATKQP